MDVVDTGRQLAERHEQEATTATEPDPVRSLLNYAEAPHDGDWSLRASLCRLAQPHPVRVSSVLELIRRLEAALHQVRRALERHTVTCDHRLTPSNFAGSDLNSGSGSAALGLPIAPYADVRVADLARLVAGGMDLAALVRGYEEVSPLDDDERHALPLLVVAVRFEKLAATLAAWAVAGPDDPPVDAVDDTCAAVAVRLDELGVPVESGPPPGMRRDRG